MTARIFLRAVFPVLLTEVALGIAQTLLSEGGDLSVLDWILVGFSLIAFPFWAGAQVARSGGSRRWSALGGVCVLLGTVVAAAVSESIPPSPVDAPWAFMFAGLLLFVPLLALFGYLGGIATHRRIHNGA